VTGAKLSKGEGLSASSALTQNINKDRARGFKKIIEGGRRA